MAAQADDYGDFKEILDEDNEESSESQSLSAASTPEAPTGPHYTEMYGGNVMDNFAGRRLLEMVEVLFTAFSTMDGALGKPSDRPAGQLEGLVLHDNKQPKDCGGAPYNKFVELTGLDVDQGGMDGTATGRFLIPAWAFDPSCEASEYDEFTVMAAMEGSVAHAVGVSFALSDIVRSITLKLPDGDLAALEDTGDEYGPVRVCPFAFDFNTGKLMELSEQQRQVVVNSSSTVLVRVQMERAQACGLKAGLRVGDASGFNRGHKTGWGAGREWGWHKGHAKAQVSMADEMKLLRDKAATRGSQSACGITRYRSGFENGTNLLAAVQGVLGFVPPPSLVAAVITIPALQAARRDVPGDDDLSCLTCPARFRSHLKKWFILAPHVLLCPICQIKFRKDMASKAVVLRRDVEQDIAAAAVAAAAATAVAADATVVAAATTGADGGSGEAVLRNAAAAGRQELASQATSGNAGGTSAARGGGGRLVLSSAGTATGSDSEAAAGGSDDGGGGLGHGLGLPEGGAET